MTSDIASSVERSRTPHPRAGARVDSRRDLVIASLRISPIFNCDGGQGCPDDRGERSILATGIYGGCGLRRGPRRNIGPDDAGRICSEGTSGCSRGMSEAIPPVNLATRYFSEGDTTAEKLETRFATLPKAHDIDCSPETIWKRIRRSAGRESSHLLRRSPYRETLTGGIAPLIPWLHAATPSGQGFSFAHAPCSVAEFLVCSRAARRQKACGTLAKSSALVTTSISGYLAPS